MTGDSGQKRMVRWAMLATLLVAPAFSSAAASFLPVHRSVGGGAHRFTRWFRALGPADRTAPGRPRRDEAPGRRGRGGERAGTTPARAAAAGRGITAPMAATRS